MVGAALSFWIYMIVVLLVAKLLGLADDNTVMLIVIVGSILLYFPMRRLFSKRESAGAKAPQGKAGSKKKK
ncbi:MAG: hypothetical protein ACOX4J_10335 [Anaerovoracaceae bacterium]|jgi:uncharacterized membrane protein